MNKMPRCFYEFASFRVDVAERQLWRDGEIVPLTSKAFDILLALVENSGQTLEKDELMQKVWANTFVEEGNLNRNISTLRKVLGDDSHQQRLIKTIPKQGYRFTADVREVLEDDKELLIEDKTRFQLKIWEEIREEKMSEPPAVAGGFSEEEKGRKGERGKRRSLSSLRFAIAASILLLLGVSLAWLWNRAQRNEARNLSLMKGTENAEAFELYQRGRALWQTRNGGNLHEATLLLEQALQKDPNFALAHAALADAYAFDYRLWKKAEPEAREAIRLDPNLGEPHASIGFVKMFWEWKLKEAEAEFKQAVQLSPNYATAHQWYAINLHAIEKAGIAAYTEMSRALELEPTSLSINADMCQTFYFLRRYDEAIAQCQKTLAMDDKFYNAHLYLYEIYNAKEMHAEAVETYFKIEELRPHPLLPPDKQEKVREAYRIGDIRSFWEAKIRYLPGTVPNHYRIAQHHARLGKTDEAFTHLQKAYKTRDFEFILFLADPTFDDLRTDQRYKELTDLLLSPKD
jgi:DNA-binding winged helix-turn-helix (wHTH) protein/Tfp pilus assembly protein PilF